MQGRHQLGRGLGDDMTLLVGQVAQDSTQAFRRKAARRKKAELLGVCLGIFGSVPEFFFPDRAGAVDFGVA